MSPGNQPTQPADDTVKTPWHLLSPICTLEPTAGQSTSRRNIQFYTKTQQQTNGHSQANSRSFMRARSGFFRSTEQKTPVRGPEQKTPVRSPEHKTPVRSPEHKTPVRSTEHKTPVRSTEHKIPVRSPEHKTQNTRHSSGAV